MKIREVKLRRIRKANTLLYAFGKFGHRYFHVYKNKENISYSNYASFKLSESGFIYFFDIHKEKWIYASRPECIKGFPHGGTMEALVRKLIKFIKTGEKLSKYNLINGNWGYGDDIKLIVEVGQQDKIITR